MLQSYTEYVKRYGIAELVFRGPSEGNPFAEQWVKGTMAGQAEEKHAEGFYDGNGVYKLRFMPEKTCGKKPLPTRKTGGQERMRLPQ